MARNSGNGAEAGVALGGCAIWVVFILIGFIGWLSHVIYRIQIHDLWFLVLGAVVAPIGVIDGWGHIFHFW